MGKRKEGRKKRKDWKVRMKESSKIKKKEDIGEKNKGKRIQSTREIIIREGKEDE